MPPLVHVRDKTWVISGPLTLVFHLPIPTQTWPSTGRIVLQEEKEAMIVSREAKETMAAFLRERQTVVPLPVIT